MTAMAKCARADAVGGSFSLWPAFSPAALRRRFLEAVACGASTRYGRRKACGGVDAAEPLPRRPRPGGSERLAELLQSESSNSVFGDAAEAKARRKVETFAALQRVAGRLQLDNHNGGEDRKVEAAAEVRRLAKDDPDARVSLAMLGVIPPLVEDRKVEAAAEVRRLAKDDPDARVSLAMLGVIPPLVGMLDCKESDLQIAALYALLNLGIGNESNKAAIVKAGAIHKMLHLIECECYSPVSEVIVANFLGLSALDSNKPIIGASGAIPFLVSAFQRPDASPTARQDALRALFNLSIAPANLPLLTDAGIVPALLSAIGDMTASERALAVLSNLVVYGEGRRAVSQTPDAFAILVDVLGWDDAAACQENAAYVLMVMAHKGRADRIAMVAAGALSALLELTLLGTPLAQKRASRLLEILTADKGKRVSEAGGTSGVAAVSAPQSGAVAATELVEGMSEERRAVKELVQQSLQSNMRRIVRRANLPSEFAPSERLRSLTSSSTSKSLPF